MSIMQRGFRGVWDIAMRIYEMYLFDICIAARAGLAHRIGSFRHRVLLARHGHNLILPVTYGELEALLKLIYSC